MNVCAYRGLYNYSLFSRSACPYCNNFLYWYDLFPLLSWIVLRRKCRFCHHPISWLYPFIELLTALACLFLYWSVPLLYLSGYFFFFSVLIVTVRTDLEDFAILPHILYLVPCGWLFSFLHRLPLSGVESMLATFVGYGLLWATYYLFLKIRKKEGLGRGDLDLLAFIGSFTGVIGIWVTLLIGSIAGSLAALFYKVMNREQSITELKIPFGPFLALGSILFVLFKNHILIYLLQ